MNLTLPLSLACFYEAGIQMGWGSSSTSVPSMAQSARATVTQNGQAFSEKKWLKQFLTLRREALANSPTEVGRETMERGNSMLKIFGSNNFDFHGPIIIDPYNTGDVFTIP
jgi:hypothetical protein